MKLDFSKSHVLENDRVKLIPLSRAHFQHLIPFSEKEPHLWEYSLLSAAGEKNMIHYLDKALEDRKNETAYPFIVWDKKVAKYAGSTRFYDYQEAHQTVQLGYTWYGAEFQGTGLNKKCKFLLLQFAFETLELERVEFRADLKNKRSIAAMKRIGCTEEGILRSNCASPTGRRDSIILSILKEEWFGLVKEELRQK